MGGRFPKLEVYLVTDRELARGRSEEEVVLAALQGGVRAVQYREKELSTRCQVEVAGRLCALAHRFGACFLVNDRVDIALAVGADGVHLGQEDLPPATARRLLGPDKLIGATVRSVEDARRAQEEGADYLGVGAMFATPTKQDTWVIGTAGLAAIRRAVGLPLVAIGGISLANTAEVVRAGADGIAVVSAVVGAVDVRAAASRLVAEVRRARAALSGSG